MPLGFQDNPGNILGTDSSNNQFASTNVAANADGSIIERIEYLQGLVAALTAGDVLLQGAADAGTSSTTEIPIAGLAGYTNDFFNDHFYMQVLVNANSAGNAPESQVRKITDYVSATGTFTCDAFGAAVEASDLCIILHESQVLLGRDDSNNVFASTNVAANADGSVLERLEAIKDQIDAVDNYVDGEITTIAADVVILKGQVGGTDGATNVLGANNNNNTFASDQVAANVDGSVLERLEDLKDRVDAVDNYVDSEVAAIKAVTDTIGTPAGADLAADIAAVKTEVDKIGTPAADVSADIAAIKLQTDEIGSAVGASISADIAAVQTALDAFAAGGGDGKAIVRKTVTFSNTDADVNLFTITAGVVFKLFAFCTTNVESAGGCNIGVDLGAGVVIADTDCTTLEANDVWHDATPDASVELESVAGKRVAYGGTIVLDIEGEKQVDSGVIVFVCVYTPLTSDGAVAAAA
ncbi:MAG: hypothetical protein WC364_13130 [Eubacteriales bacterium]|jgi:hypothetical protein